MKKIDSLKCNTGNRISSSSCNNSDEKCPNSAKVFEISNLFKC